MTALVAFAAGVAFALGLGLGGLTSPARVLAFLDVTGRWDPSLAFVMGGAVAAYALLRPMIMRRRRPLLTAGFAEPARTELDAPLLGGAVLFGVGWGLAGFCPGPAFVAVGAAVPQAIVFVGSMLTGMLIYNWRWRTA